MRGFTVLIVLLSVLSSAAGEVQPQWTAALPKRKPAWEHTQRMLQDKSYEPVTAGSLVFVGLETSGAMIAFDVASGAEKWRYYTNGPIRWAPAVSTDRVYLGSDDGYLYCLDHAGKLMWKFRGGPSDRLVIGHERIMSSWPISSRPLLTDVEQPDKSRRAMLFITAGFWPVDGVYTIALDPVSGKVIWSSDRGDYRPFGSMKVFGGTLFPSGYNSSAAFNIHTGQLTDEKPPAPAAAGAPVAPAPAIPAGLPSTGWRHSNATGMYHVVGSETGVTCYAEASPPATGPAPDNSPKPAAMEDAVANQVLTATKIDHGYALVIGGEVRFIETLLRKTKLHVVAVEADDAAARDVRRQLDALGLFDEHRLSVLAGDPAKLGLPPHFASLVTSRTALSDAARQAVQQCVRPYGGLIAGPAGTQVNISRHDGPLPGADDWAHEFHDESNTLASRDKRVKAPLGLLWYGGVAAHGKYYFDGFIDHQSGHGLNPQPTSPLIIQGRMVLQSQGLLAAFDIYTGRLLWETPLPAMYSFGGKDGGLGIHSKNHPEPWKFPQALEAEVLPTQHPRSSGFDMVATSDAIYVGAAEKCLVIDPVTGKVVKSFKLPLPEAKLCWGYPRIVGDLLVSTAFRPKDLEDAQAGFDGNGGDWAGDRMPMAHLFAINRHTGELAWSRKANWGFLNRGTAIGNGKVFALDMVMEDVLNKWKEAKRDLPAATPPMLYALDLKTGRELWKAKIDVLVKNIVYSPQRDLLLVPCRHTQRWQDGAWESERSVKSNKKQSGTMHAFRGASGEIAYTVEEGPYYNPHIILDDLVIDRNGFAYDLLTGNPSVRRNPLTGVDEPWGFSKGGCGHLIACDNLVTWRTAFYDLQSGAGVMKLTGMDAGCTPTLIPAGGLLNIPNFGTHHKRNRMTAMALIHRPDNAVWTQYQFSKPTGPTQPTAVKRAGYLFGAPGDRLADDGTLWQSVGARKSAELKIEPKTAGWFANKSADWRVGGGITGATSITIPTAMNSKTALKGQPFTVRLYFTEPPGPARLPAGQRRFDVSLEGKPVLENFDIAREQAGENKPVVREFKNVVVDGPLNITLTAGAGATLLSAVEIISE